MFERWGDGAVGFLKKAILAVLLVFVLAAVVTWGRSNPTQAQATTNKVMTAGASVIGWAADGVTNLTGGSAGQAATAGPETIWVDSTAPAGWHVRQAVLTWNKGLTTAKLRLGPCREGAECIHVKQVGYLAPSDGRLTLGRTSSFFGSSPTIRLNADAIGQVPASVFQVAACHEIGHALGVEHNPSTASCMHATIGAGVPARPDAADFAAVNAKHG